MINRFRRSILLGFTGALLLSSATMRGQSPPFYLRGDAGGVLTSDTSLKEFFGEPLAPGSKITFDPGVRIGFAAGYNVTDWFAAEAETGVMVNNIRSVTGASRTDASFSNVPLLVNARFQCPSTKCRLTPYLGGGLGMSAAVLSIDHLDLGGTRVHGTDSDAVFAYQGFAGLRYRLNDNMGLSLEYHYFGTTAPQWRADFARGTATDRLRFGRIETHAITVAFDWRF